MKLLLRCSFNVPNKHMKYNKRVKCWSNSFLTDLTLQEDYRKGKAGREKSKDGDGEGEKETLPYAVNRPKKKSCIALALQRRGCWTTQAHAVEIREKN